jgi:hypothetical protein
VTPEPNRSTARRASVKEQFRREQRGEVVARTRADVPGAPAQLSCGWLTDVLCQHHSGAAVVAFELGPEFNPPRYSSRRLRVSYNAAGTDAGLPEHLFSKSLPRLTSRTEIGLAGYSASETTFYATVRPLLTMSVPQCYYAGYDEESLRVFLLLEDVVHTRQATFGTALDMVIERPAAESMVTQMAAYHGAFWGRAGVLADRIPTVLQAQTNWNDALSYERHSFAAFDYARAVVPDIVFERRTEWHAALMRSKQADLHTPTTLLHCDTHLGNWYRSGATMGLTDWQAVAVGTWALDVVYALSIALTVDDRRAWETGLLALYLDRLGAAGGAAPPFDQAWLAYRQQAFHACGAWLVTHGYGDGRRPVDADICEINIARAAQAVADLESFDALPRS